MNMRICGLKLTHDGAIALIEGNRLVFSVEMEKLNNHPRYKDIEETAVIEKVLQDYGYDLSAVDFFVVDGWGGTDQDALAIQPRLEIGTNHNWLSIYSNGEPLKLGVAPYEEKSLKHDITQTWQLSGLKIGRQTFDYQSYLHGAGHLMGTYCSSPFAQKGESSYILVWDGGMYPRLYYFDVQKKQVENFGPIFLLIGNIYTIFSQYFGPFKVQGNFAKDNLSTAGKVMAYIALGKVRRELFDDFDKIYVGSYDVPMGFANLFANEFKKMLGGRPYADEDILHTFHVYLEELLIKKLEKKVKRYPRESRNLCMSGGCALNIKWNSAIRNRGLFKEVYVPPFPNDSGSAVGAACCAMIKETGHIALEWTVYSGPPAVKKPPPPGWYSKECSIEELAVLLHRTNEPVVFLHGRAELGPRALGNRSILASPVSPNMKDLLNKIKKREFYRPVSPICLEQQAPRIFEPGSRDPYMLFDHKVKSGWQDKIPAVLHLDGTARLQTISSQDNAVVTRLLSEYERISGIPLLCNTSANFKGCGFFPDVFSAAQWGGTNYIWCEQTLYEKEIKTKWS
jgi:carbamoyltransferase